MSQKNNHESQRADTRQNQSQGPMEQGVKINGLDQVVEMLRFADPTFRESLLKRIAQRDPALAMSLKRIIR